ncbi:nucleotidyltransferase family protein [Gammaproteobacteria bacterium]|nr:nucleotidyltransferase family protein [Gammaproteobacteria bacterium]
MQFPFSAPHAQPCIGDARALFGLLLGDSPDPDSERWRLDFVARLGCELPLLEAIEYHGLGPALYYRLRDDLRGDARVRLKLLAWRQHRFARFRQQALSEMLAAFAAANLPLVLLKGAALANSVYPANDWRPMSDIDVLIPSERGPEALKLLRDLGYHCGDQPLNRRLIHHHLPTARQRIDDVELAIELHTDAFSCDVPWSLTWHDLPRDLPLIRIGDYTANGLPPDWQLTHLAIHQTEPALWPTFKGYLDALLVMRAHPDCFAKKLSADDARVIGQRYAALLGALLAADASDNPLPALMPASGIPTIEEMRAIGAVKGLSALLWPSRWWLRLRYGWSVFSRAQHLLHVATWGIKRIPSWLSGTIRR